MKDFCRSYFLESNDLDTNRVKEPSKREEYKFTPSFVKVHAVDCPFTKNSCSKHRENLKNNTDSCVLISFHPSLRNDDLLQTVQVVSNKKYCPTKNMLAISNNKYFQNKEASSHEAFQNPELYLNSTSYGNVSKTLIKGKVSKYKKLKQCFHSPCSSLVHVSFNEESDCTTENSIKRTRNISGQGYQTQNEKQKDQGGKCDSFCQACNRQKFTCCDPYFLFPISNLDSLKENERVNIAQGLKGDEFTSTNKNLFLNKDLRDISDEKYFREEKEEGTSSEKVESDSSHSVFFAPYILRPIASDTERDDKKFVEKKILTSEKYVQVRDKPVMQNRSSSYHSIKSVTTMTEVMTSITHQGKSGVEDTKPPLRAEKGTKTDNFSDTTIPSKLSLLTQSDQYKIFDNEMVESLKTLDSQADKNTQTEILSDSITYFTNSLTEDKNAHFSFSEKSKRSSQNEVPYPEIQQGGKRDAEIQTLSLTSFEISKPEKLIISANTKNAETQISPTISSQFVKLNNEMIKQKDKNYFYETVLKKSVEVQVDQSLTIQVPSNVVVTLKDRIVEKWTCKSAQTTPALTRHVALQIKGRSKNDFSSMATQTSSAEYQCTCKEMIPVDAIEIFNVNFSSNETYIVKNSESYEFDSTLENQIRQFLKRSYSDSELCDKKHCRRWKSDEENQIFDKCKKMPNCTPKNSIRSIFKKDLKKDIKNSESFPETSNNFKDPVQEVISTKQQTDTTPISDLSELIKLIDKCFDKKANEIKGMCECRQDQELTHETTKILIDQGTMTNIPFESADGSENIKNLKKEHIHFAEDKTHDSKNKAGTTKETASVLKNPNQVYIRRAVPIEHSKNEDIYICKVCEERIRIFTVNIGTNTVRDDETDLPEDISKSPKKSTTNETHTYEKTLIQFNDNSNKTTITTGKSPITIFSKTDSVHHYLEKNTEKVNVCQDPSIKQTSTNTKNASDASFSQSSKQTPLTSKDSTPRERRRHLNNIKAEESEISYEQSTEIKTTASKPSSNSSKYAKSTATLTHPKSQSNANSTTDKNNIKKKGEKNSHTYPVIISPDYSRNFVRILQQKIKKHSKRKLGVPSIISENHKMNHGLQMPGVNYISDTACDNPQNERNSCFLLRPNSSGASLRFMTRKQVHAPFHKSKTESLLTQSERILVPDMSDSKVRTLKEKIISHLTKSDASLRKLSNAKLTSSAKSGKISKPLFLNNMQHRSISMNDIPENMESLKTSCNCHDRKCLTQLNAEHNQRNLSVVPENIQTVNFDWRGCNGEPLLWLTVSDDDFSSERSHSEKSNSVTD